MLAQEVPDLDALFKWLWEDRHSYKNLATIVNKVPDCVPPPENSTGGLNRVLHF